MPNRAWDRVILLSPWLFAGSLRRPDEAFSLYPGAFLSFLRLPEIGIKTVCGQYRKTTVRGRIQRRMTVHRHSGMGV
jgi:hypothetical protein